MSICLRCFCKQYTWKSISLQSLQTELAALKADLTTSVETDRDHLSNSIKEKPSKAITQVFKVENIMKKKSSKRNNAEMKLTDMAEETLFTCESMGNMLEERNRKKTKLEITRNIKKIKELSIKEKELMTEIKKMQQNELNRLSKEFLHNDYARRFKTDRKIVIGAMVGQENLNQVIAKQKRQVKVNS